MLRITTTAVAAMAMLGVSQAAPITSEFVTGYDRTVPQLGKSRPELNQPFTDDVYGTTIRRISEPNDVSSQWVRHEYARRQAFNADGTRLIMLGNNGAWMLYDINAKDEVSFSKKLPSMSEPNWHPTNPDVFWYFPRNGALTIHKYNVTTGASSEVANFAGRLPWSGVEHVWTQEEGEPSADGKIWCLAAEDSNFKTVGMFSYNIETDTIIGTAGLSADPNHISTSPSGEYCVPSGSGIGGTWAYSLDFTESQQLHTNSEHSDLAIDADGRDVFVYGDYSTGWVTMVDMATGEKTQLVDIYEIGGSGYALHISGNNYDAPGYAVLSTYNATVDYGATKANYGDIWGHDRLAVFELKANPEIYNVAYMHNAYTSYWTEPHATVNQDLSRILFVSNWESGREEDIGTYMVSLESADTGGGGGGGGTVSAPEDTRDFSGLWYNPNQSGHGFSVQQLDTANGRELLAFWFTYINGQPRWILAQGPMSGSRATLDAIITDGGDFPPYFDADDVKTSGWGTLTFEFDSEQNATVRWNDVTGNFGSGSLPLKRLSKIADQPQACFSGAWYDRTQPGHGMLVEIVDGGSRAVVTWYAYLQGRQTWMQGSAPISNGRASIDMLQFSGGDVPSRFNPSAVFSRNWGRLNLEFVGTNTLKTSWSPAVSGYRPGSLSLSRLTSVSGHECG